jgi:hypothetical protein
MFPIFSDIKNALVAAAISLVSVDLVHGFKESDLWLVCLPDGIQGAMGSACF